MTMDLAVGNGHKEIADIINATVQQEKNNRSCDYVCPQFKINSEMPAQCYQPDLLEGILQPTYFFSWQ